MSGVTARRDGRQPDFPCSGRGWVQIPPQLTPFRCFLTNFLTMFGSKTSEYTIKRLFLREVDLLQQHIKRLTVENIRSSDELKGLIAEQQLRISELRHVVGQLAKEIDELKAAKCEQ